MKTNRWIIAGVVLGSLLLGVIAVDLSIIADAARKHEDREDRQERLAAVVASIERERAPLRKVIEAMQPFAAGLGWSEVPLEQIQFANSVSRACDRLAQYEKHASSPVCERAIRELVDELKQVPVLYIASISEEEKPKRLTAIAEASQRIAKCVKQIEDLEMTISLASHKP